MKRYQQCSWIEKRWRDRWRIAIPTSALAYWLAGLRIYKDELVSEKITHTDQYHTASLKQCRNIAKSEIEVNKLKYYFTIEEVKQELKRRFNL